MTTTLVTDLPVDSSQTDEIPIQNGFSDIEETNSNDSTQSSSACEPLSCAICNQKFQDRSEYSTHILEHIKQPQILLQRVVVPKPEIEVQPTRSFARKHIRPYKNHISQIIEHNGSGSDDDVPRVPKLRILLPAQLSKQYDDLENAKSSPKTETDDSVDSKDGILPENDKKSTETMVELHSLPSESQSPSFPGPSPGQPEVSINQQDESNSFWNDVDAHTTADPNRHQESGQKEVETHDSLLQNFLNDTNESISSKESALIPTNETEFISLDRLAGPQCSTCGERFVDQSSFDIHCKATGHFPSNSLMPFNSGQLSTHNPLDSLTNLPMQQLAQQVNRLQQGQVHQQNVLINIQQFGQPMPPPPPPYGGSDMGHMHHMPHFPPQQQQAPPHSMYMPHPQFQPPPHPMYYPGAPGSMFMPPHSQAQQRSGPSMGPQRPQFSHEGNMMPPRMPPPRIAPPQMRPPQIRPQHQPRGVPSGRGRMGVPNVRPVPNVRQAAPPHSAPQMVRGGNTHQQRMMQHKRNLQEHQQQQQQIKKKRMDILIPDTNDDADCHVISMQTCKDGLPIIKNVQGATTVTEVDPVVHLTDSITLSVRNPKETPVQTQKKNDAKAVANILATRGITVTPASKSLKETVTSPTTKTPPAPVAINLNSAVSIIPTARNQQGGKANNPPAATAKTQTVDLTEDETPANSQTKTAQGNPKRALPHQCDLCPAQYPSMRTLIIHRRQYHKAGPQSDLGVPIIDLSQPTVLSKLASLGIHSYIPLPQTGSGNNATFALPIVSVNGARNPNVCNISALGSGAVLTLGPLHHISNLPARQGN